MKKFISAFYILLVTGYWLLVTFPASAQVASQASNLSPEIKDKLQILQTEIASKAAVIKQEISQKLSNRAYIGFIKEITDSKLTLSTRFGEKSVTLNQDTDYFSKSSNSSSKNILFKNLSSGDLVAALGDVDELEVLTAKRLVKFTKSAQITKKVVWGKVQTISDSNLTIKDRDNQILTINIDSNTDFKSGNSLISLSKIKQGSVVVVSGEQAEDQQISAGLIYLFPKLNSDLNKTPQATTSASKKAT